jgi:hypothetical protein
MRPFYLLLLLLSITSITVKSQSDFRNVYWGMTIEEVKENEAAPLTREEKSSTGYRNGKYYYSGIDLIYTNVTVAELKADIKYHFDNGKLTKIDVIYRPDIYRDYNVEISQLIRNFHPLHAALGRKLFKMTAPLRCGDHAFSGPDRTHEGDRKLFYELDWGFNDDVLSLIERMVNEKKYKAVFYRAENKRTRAAIQFNTKYSEFASNNPALIYLTPSFDVSNNLNESDF